VRTTWRGEWPSLALLAIVLATSVWGWAALPDRVPVHWNAQGQIDRYGSKLEGVAIMPIVAVGVYLLFLALPLIDPWRASYVRFDATYRVLRVGLLAFLAFLNAVVVGSTAGLALDAPLLIGIATAALLLGIGAVLHDVKPNFFVGIRTPWTLASPRSWAATHRWGGRVLVVGGLLLGAAVLARSAVAIVGAIVALAAALLVLVAYSYLVWRDDPERIAAPAPR